MRVSVVIITWNGRGHLEKCVSSLAEFISRPDVEAIVVDNGSCDGTAGWLKASFPDIRLIELDENKGVAFARNRGLEVATGDYLLILDNDTVVTAEALDGMMAYMESQPEVGICGCRLVDNKGTVQESCKKYPGLIQKILNVLNGSRYRYAYGTNMMQHAFEPEYLIGACQLIRRKAYEEVGALDEHIFIGPEDADFCLRIRKKGWHVMYLPQFTITHCCQRITNRHLFSSLGRKHISALFYLYKKHKRLI